MFIVLMNGNPATGKTTTARRIYESFVAAGFKVKIISTLDVRKKYNYFDLFSESERNKVYDLLAEDILNYLNTNSKEIIIVDGNFNSREKRYKIYAHLKQHELCAIKCFVGDISTVKERLDYRKANQHLEENKATSLDLFYLIKKGSDDLTNDVVNVNGYSIIEYDSEKSSASIAKLGENCSMDIIKTIVQTLNSYNEKI